MDTNVLDRLTGLPEESARRRMILQTFGCRSLAPVILRLWAAEGEQKTAIEVSILAILDDPPLLA